MFPALVTTVATVVQAAAAHGKRRQAELVTLQALPQRKVITALPVKQVVQQVAAAEQLLLQLQVLAELVIHHFQLGLQLHQLEVLDLTQQAELVTQAAAELLEPQLAAMAAAAAGTYLVAQVDLEL
jgi:hypothetical protein